jgi:energy-coupling factor transporter ATP-binding protein EcfA2
VRHQPGLGLTGKMSPPDFSCFRRTSGDYAAPMLQSIQIRGYRSLREFRLKPAFQLCLRTPELKRDMNAAELSDGTLRFFCLAAALLSPKPPPLLVLNEPEASLHAGLIEPLADLITQVPNETQILIVTHSQVLADSLAASCGAEKVELVSHEGETRPLDHAGAKRAWSFE